MSLSKKTHPNDFEEKVAVLKEMDRVTYARAIRSIKLMAEGDDPAALRIKHYPDWTDEDFEDLLRMLGEKE